MNFIEVKSILNKQKHRDEWFLTDYSMNPYSGCQINCAYCYTRGSKYGENMAATFSVKANAAELLRKQLRRRAEKKQFGFIGLASATDPYPPIEERTQLTRELLRIVLEFRFPLALSTKSTLVLRDLDLLTEIDRIAVVPDDLRNRVGHGVIVMTSLSTLDPADAAVLEPGAASPADRLNCIRRCVENRLFAGVAFMPLLPFLSDSEQHLESMIKVARDCGARFVFVSGLTLFGNGTAGSKTLYSRFLSHRHPELVERILKMFGRSPFPSREYSAKLDRMARNLCSKNSVRYRID